MSDSFRASIRTNLENKQTDELVEIWQEHDLNEWTELTFDIVREILEERKVDLSRLDKPNKRKLRPEIDQITNVAELEQKIKNCEKSLLLANNEKTANWIPLLISAGIAITTAIKIPFSEIYWIIMFLALLYLAFNIWRMYNAEQKKKNIESELKEYLDKKIELQKLRI
jgi:hypothetical protein